LSEQKITGGWGWPGNSRKAHYFEEGQITSICGKWLYRGPREQGNDGSPDNCTACRRALQKKREKAAAEKLQQTGKLEY